jgi:hypothetical protein
MHGLKGGAYVFKEGTYVSKDPEGAHMGKEGACIGGGERSGEELGMIWAKDTKAHMVKETRTGGEVCTGKRGAHG